MFMLLLDDLFINGVLRNKQHLFVANCSLRKEFKSHYSQYVNALYQNLRRLKGLFHSKNGQEGGLPDDIRIHLSDVHASDCDIQIAAIAFDRLRCGQDVMLVSNDPHFSSLQTCFERHGIRIMNLKSFRATFNIAS